MVAKTEAEKQNKHVNLSNEILHLCCCVFQHQNHRNYHLTLGQEAELIFLPLYFWTPLGLQPSHPRHSSPPGNTPGRGAEATQ